MATKKMQAGGAKFTTNKRPIDLNIKERTQKNRPLKGAKMQKGGPTDYVTAMYKAKGEKVPTTKETLKYVKKNGSGYVAPEKGKAPAGFVDGRSATPSTRKYKTGGMVNANANLKATATAGSKGVKSGVNPKAAASKVARGRVGGTSAAPKTATPKAKYGMSVTKMKKK